MKIFEQTSVSPAGYFENVENVGNDFNVFHV